MITKVFGVILILASSAVLIVNTFVLLNSSVVLPYHNVDKLTLQEAKVFFPYFVATLTLIMGILLAKDRVLESHH